MKKILVLGNGSFGCALAELLNNNNQIVSIWGRNKEKNQILREKRTLSKALGSKKLNNNIQIIDDLEESKNYDIWLISISSNGMDDLTKQLNSYYNDQIIINTTKGMNILETIKKNLNTDKIVELSGPTHAEEVIQGLPTLCVAGSKIPELATEIQKIFSNEVFRVYVNNDVLGIELSAALKNIIAIAAGICDGIGYGDNAKAALITRGMTEIKRLGLAMGAEEETFNGLAGIGDLIVTCESIHSRNRKYGYLIGQGKTSAESLEEIGMVVEGLNAIDAAYEKAKELNVEMPIVNEIYSVIHQNQNPRDAIRRLMTRDLKIED